MIGLMVNYLRRRFAYPILAIIAGLALIDCAAQSQTAGSDVRVDPTIVVSPTPPGPANPNEQFLNTVRNEVNGVGIGNTDEEVFRQFGKPLSLRKRGINPCGGAKTVVRYQGLAFTLDGDLETRDIVVLIEITSPKWEIAPGIRIGFTLAEVHSKMGRLGNLSTEEGSNSLGYADGDGYINFYFKDGKLAKIVRDLNQC